MKCKLESFFISYKEAAILSKTIVNFEIEIRIFLLAT